MISGRDDGLPQYILEVIDIKTFSMTNLIISFATSLSKNVSIPSYRGNGEDKFILTTTIHRNPVDDQFLISKTRSTKN